jgi:diguanylate cyclase (GGDEF)-like protein
MRPLFLPLILLLVVAGAAHAAPPPPVDATAPVTTPLGRDVSYLKETEGPLSLEQAITAYRQGKFVPNRTPVLNFGIGSVPVWLHLRVNNPSAQPLTRQLSVETAWLDQLDIYYLYDDETVASDHGGDIHPFKERALPRRYFTSEHIFPPGGSDLFIRIQTPDPLVVPIYLLSPELAHEREVREEYSYGFLYGFLIALLAYNFMLYVGLRDMRYLLYSLYLGLFVVMNLSYTGHAFEWLWPDSTQWAQWSNPVLMVLYGTSGLLFALRFLDVRSHFPRLYRGVVGYITTAALLLLLAILFDSQRSALFVSFTFVFFFTFIMLGLGITALRSGQTPARYFLLAAIAAMLGAASTALSVSGFIPTNTWTYRAVDIGIIMDATLLALALTYQFRLNQMQKLHAERLAMLDPLTGLNNRRAFYSLGTPIWNISLRHDNALAVILLDIDTFKSINDTFGHLCGDEVLTAIAKVMQMTIREQDIMARWGGEEFIVLLPETDLQAAVHLAERLRNAIEKLQLGCVDSDFKITASFGVAQRDNQHQSLEALISAADVYLYRGKESGKNVVSYDEAHSATVVDVTK